KRIVSGGDDGQIMVWDLKTGVELHRLGIHQNSVMSVITLPDNRRAVSVSGDTTVKLCDIDEGIEIATLGNHSDSIHQLKITSDGRYALTIRADDESMGAPTDSLIVWDIEKTHDHRILCGHKRDVTDVAVFRLNETEPWRAISCSFD